MTVNLNGLTTPNQVKESVVNNVKDMIDVPASYLDKAKVPGPFLAGVNQVIPYEAFGGGELLTKGAGIPRDSLKSRIIWESPKDQRHYLMEEIKKAGVMNPQPNHNWKFIPETWTIPAAACDRKLLFGE